MVWGSVVVYLSVSVYLSVFVYLSVVVWRERIAQPSPNLRPSIVFDGLLMVVDCVLMAFDGV